jgi:F-type H+-transporting ATPase subunit gamma
MPASAKILRRRIRSIKATGKITRAMEMVSAAKLRRAQSILLAGRPYAQNLQQLLGHLAGSASVAEHPLFAQREGNSRIMVVFTGDRGLAGGFNSNLIKLVETELKSQPNINWKLYLVGKKGHDYFKRRQWPIVRSITGLSGRPDLELAREIANDLLARFTSGEADSIYLFYHSFVSLAIYRPKLAKFLNLDQSELAAAEAGAAAKGPALDYILEPSAERVFDALLPRYLTSKIYITMAEVFTAEHSARMIAMNNATKNCKELTDQLTLQMNKARQAQITRELIDIVGGAQAVS